MAQISANIVAIILFASIHYMIKELLQKQVFGIKNNKIIKLFSLSLEGATLFLSQQFQHYLHLKDP